MWDAQGMGVVGTACHVPYKIPPKNLNCSWLYASPGSTCPAHCPSSSMLVSREHIPPCQPTPSQVFPEHKFLLIAALQQGGFAVGMTGDGVNDAPALKRADVGIAVSGATDAARAAADIVLTEPGLRVIVDALVVARCIFQRIYNFFNCTSPLDIGCIASCVCASHTCDIHATPNCAAHHHPLPADRIAATLQLLTFFFIALFAFPPNAFPPNPADAGLVETNYFQLPVLMLMLITLLNDGTLISIAYDRVTPSPRPEKWNLAVLFVTSAVLAAVACGSSLLLLWGALDSNNPDGWFAAWGLPGLQYGQVGRSCGMCHWHGRQQWKTFFACLC